MNVEATGNEKEVDARDAEKKDKKKIMQKLEGNNVTKHEPPLWFAVSLPQSNIKGSFGD